MIKFTKPAVIKLEILDLLCSKLNLKYTVHTFWRFLLTLTAHEIDLVYLVFFLNK